MAAAIRSAHGVEPELIAGAGGVFDVKLDGTIVFSKHEVGRFPEEREVLDKLAALTR